MTAFLVYRRGRDSLREYPWRQALRAGASFCGAWGGWRRLLQKPFCGYVGML